MSTTRGLPQTEYTTPFDLNISQAIALHRRGTNPVRHVLLRSNSLRTLADRSFSTIVRLLHPRCVTIFPRRRSSLGSRTDSGGRAREAHVNVGESAKHFRALARTFDGVGQKRMLE